MQGRIPLIARIVFGSVTLIFTLQPRVFSQQVTSPQAHFHVLHKFKGQLPGSKDGFDPVAVIVDKAGNLFGTTLDGGGTQCNGGFGCGIVFKLDSSGKETILHRFTGSASDQGNPLGGVIEDAAGNLYGTTSGGSINKGTIFKLDPSGKVTFRHDFTGSDGLAPYAGLVGDGAGNLYGTTTSGGASGHGVMFKVAKTGKESVLYSFTGGADGDSPEAGLVRDAAGNLYGTTFAGGTAGQGTVFKLDTTGKQTVVYSFTGGTDGGTLMIGEGVVLDRAGDLYGTTTGGGDLTCNINAVPGCGVVFKIDKAGKETVLYTFKGKADGGNPSTGVVRDAAGKLYGATQFGGGHFGCLGGSNDCGVVFKLSKTGKLTVLHAFTGGADGGAPTSLVRDAAGNLYGTAATGGTCNNQGCGTVFKITP